MDVKLNNEMVKRLAKERFGSQKALAEAIGVNVGTFYNMTNGYMDYPKDVAMRIAKVFEINLHDLMKDTKHLSTAELYEKVKILTERVNTLENKVNELENRGFFSKFFG